jgi:uncharacterized membrane protein
MNAIFTLLFVAVGLLLIGLAIPLMRRLVRPNRLYGLRVPATFADDWVWYEANARTGRDLFCVGLFQITMAILLAVVPGVTDPLNVGINAAILFVGAIVMAAAGWKRANRLLDQRRSSGAK